jgi:serine/threonine-protein kinase RsbW
MMDLLNVDISIGSRFDNIDLVDDVAEAVLRRAGLDDDGVERLGLAIREAVANGVQHGNKGQPEKRVSISFVFNTEELSIRIQDEGDGFDLGGLPDPLAPENLFKPRGRGILLMRSFMDEVDFEFSGTKGTVVRMFKRLTDASNEQSKEDQE